MSSALLENGDDTVTIILTFGIIIVMFASLLVDKLGTGELFDY